MARVAWLADDLLQRVGLLTSSSYQKDATSEDVMEQWLCQTQCPVI